MNRTLLLLGLLLPGMALGLESIDEGELSNETGATPALVFTQNPAPPRPPEPPPCLPNAEIEMKIRLKPEQMAQANVEEVIARNNQTMMDLYRDGLRGKVCVPGEILLDAAIDGRGAVTNLVSKVSDPGLQELANKLRATFQGLRYPAFGKPDALHFTLTFHSRQQ